MPVNFGKDIAPRQIQAIASYDYVDIEEGTGVVVYHGAATKTSSGGFIYELTRNGYYSSQIASGGINLGLDDLKLLDVNFDVTFVKPRIISGKSLINVPIQVSGNVSASAYMGYVTCAIKKVSEGVSTELFALTSGSMVVSAESAQSGYSAIQANLPTTHFKEDDTLRLQVQLYGRGNGADSAYVLMGMDPKNRTSSGSLSEETLLWVTGESDLQLHVPFRLDI